LCIKIGGVDAKGFFEFGLGSTICFWIRIQIRILD
jgi:hypothetical protein